MASVKGSYRGLCIFWVRFWGWIGIWVRGQISFAGNEEFGQKGSMALEDLSRLFVAGQKLNGGIETAANGFADLAGFFQGFEGISPGGEKDFKIRGELGLMPLGGSLRSALKVDRTIVLIFGMENQPGFIRGKDQDGSHDFQKGFGGGMLDGLAGAALGAIGAFAIHAIFDDVEVSGRELVGAELIDQAGDRMEIVALIGGITGVNEPMEFVEEPAIDGR